MARFKTYSKLIAPALAFLLTRGMKLIGMDIDVGEDEAQSLIDHITPIIMLVATWIAPKNKE